MSRARVAVEEDENVMDATEEDVLPSYWPHCQQDSGDESDEKSDSMCSSLEGIAVGAVE